MNKMILFGNIGICSLLLVLIAGIYIVSNAPAKAVYFAPISSQLYMGSRGQDVTNLQIFLSSNRDIYPEGLVTGYYGPLTAKAVKNFQLYYGIPTVGWVGPQTLARINSVIAAGRGIDIYGPIMQNIAVQQGSASATFAWTANEPVIGKVYYSRTPFFLAEAAGNFMPPTIIGGAYAVSSAMQSSHHIIAQGLEHNAVYYYMIQSTDASGNVSVTLPATFATN